MRKLFTTRRRIGVVAATVIAVLTAGGVAFAYFTSTGNGTGSGAVGTAGTWTVAPAAVSGTIYPGQGTETITFTVTNTGSGNQELSTWTPSVDKDGSGNIYSGGTTGNAVSNPPSGATDVTGCLATWFTPTVTLVNGAAPAAVDVTAGGTATVTVQLTMTDAAANQNSCQSTTPDVYLSVG